MLERICNSSEVIYDWNLLEIRFELRRWRTAGIFCFLLAVCRRAGKQTSQSISLEEIMSSEREDR